MSGYLQAYASAMKLCYRKEDLMEGILFFIIWIGGASVHTYLELRKPRGDDR